MVKVNLRNQGNRRRRGFTLIELLAATAITAIIGVVLSSSVIQLMTVQSSTKNRTDAVKQVENALHYINTDAQMASPGQIRINSGQNQFIQTTLSGSSSVGATSITVANSTGFLVPGTLTVGSGSTLETLTYTAIAGNNLTILPAAKAHSSGAPVSTAMTLKWYDNASVRHVVSYSLATISGTKYLQRSETVASANPVTLRLAGPIEPETSSFSFDGQVISITLTSTVNGLRSASETRTLVVQVRPTI